MSDAAAQRLIHNTKESYGSSFNADLLEQYKLYVQSAENVSARRVASIQYLLTVNAALVALSRVAVRRFWRELLDVACSHYRDSRLPALALDHQVTR